MLFSVTKQIIRGVRKVRKLATEQILLKYTEAEHKKVKSGSERKANIQTLAHHRSSKRS